MVKGVSLRKRDNRTIIASAAVAVVVIGALLVTGIIPSSMTGFSVGGADKEAIANRVKVFYELANPGSIVEITAIDSQSGMYKIVLKITGAAGTTYGEAYVTKDGNLFTASVFSLEDQITGIQRSRDFVECLAGKNVMIFGSVQDQATALQLNVLGAYGSVLFMPCDGENVQICVDAGIEQIPSVVIGQMIEPGAKSVDWFEQVTGCEW